MPGSMAGFEFIAKPLADHQQACTILDDPNRRGIGPRPTPARVAAILDRGPSAPAGSRPPPYIVLCSRDPRSRSIRTGWVAAPALQES